VNDRAHTIVLELPPVDLAAQRGEDEPMALLPVYEAVIPIDAMVHAVRVDVVDGAGRVLPREMLHHFNLTDPERRELFLPVSMHLFAASKETPEITVPRLLIGLPLARGQRLLAGGMLANPTPSAVRGAHIRLVMSYVAPGRIFPLYRAYPWAMDVMFPLGRASDGSKAFDLPPGRSVRSWESQPAVPGRIAGLGGHVHDYAVSLELRDVTTNEVLWRGAPVREPTGRVLSMPVTRFVGWRGAGVPIVPSHRYRVTVAYDNPTGRTLQEAGMGAVGGLFVPDRGARWPKVDIADPTYLTDLDDVIRQGGGGAMVGHMHH
jgi:hypothetical protein